MQRRSCHVLAARPIESFGSRSRDVQTVMGDGTAVSKAGADLLGNRRFESISLRRPVCLNSAFHAYRRKDPAFAGSVSLDETRERDVMAPSRLALAAFL